MTTLWRTRNWCCEEIKFDSHECFKAKYRLHFLILKSLDDIQIIDTSSFKQRTHLWHHMSYVYISFIFISSFCRCDLLTKNANVDEEKEETEEIEKATIKTKTAITTETKRLLNSRWRRDICILINIALFICLNKRKHLLL